IGRGPDGDGAGVIGRKVNAHGDGRVAAEEGSAKRTFQNIQIVILRIKNPNLQAIIIGFRGKVAGEGEYFRSGQRDRWRAQLRPLIIGDETRLSRNESARSPE